MCNKITLTILNAFVGAIKNIVRLINVCDVYFHISTLVLVTPSIKLFDWSSIPDTCTTACATYPVTIERYFYATKTSCAFI